MLTYRPLPVTTMQQLRLLVTPLRLAAVCKEPARAVSAYLASPMPALPFLAIRIRVLESMPKVTRMMLFMGTLARLQRPACLGLMSVPALLVVQAFSVTAALAPEL